MGGRYLVSRKTSYLAIKTAFRQAVHLLVCRAHVRTEHDNILIRPSPARSCTCIYIRACCMRAEESHRSRTVAYGTEQHLSRYETTCG